MVIVRPWWRVGGWQAWWSTLDHSGCGFLGVGRNPCRLDTDTVTDEGMTNGSPMFAYLVFGQGGVSFERFSRPTKASARRGLGATLGVQAKLRGVQVGLVFV
jgi:hypothetical protein